MLDKIGIEMTDEAPTYMMANEKVRQEIEDIISRLKKVDVDGETMQYILEEVGMSDQILRQLVRKVLVVYPL